MAQQPAHHYRASGQRIRQCHPLGPSTVCGETRRGVLQPGKAKGCGLARRRSVAGTSCSNRAAIQYRILCRRIPKPAGWFTPRKPAGGNAVTRSFRGKVAIGAILPDRTLKATPETECPAAAQAEGRIGHSRQPVLVDVGSCCGLNRFLVGEGPMTTSLEQRVGPRRDCFTPSATI